MKEEWLRRKEMSEQKQSLYLGAVFRDNYIVQNLPDSMLTYKDMKV